MEAVMQWIDRIIALIPAVHLTNVLEILIISVLIYYILICGGLGVIVYFFKKNIQRQLITLTLQIIFTI